MSLPLTDRTILITRSRSQAPVFRDLLEKAGAKVLELPTIEIRPRPSRDLDAAIKKLAQYHWIIFTSVHGVEIFMKRFRVLRPLLASKTNFTPKIATIGPATADCVKKFGYCVSLTPKVYQAEGLLKAFLGFNNGRIKNLQILLPRASQAREILPEKLRKSGSHVDVIHVYDTEIPIQKPAFLEKFFRKNPPDLIAFTSSSTVRNFLTMADKFTNVNHYVYAAIGPITAATARKKGLDIAVQSNKSSIPDFVNAIERYFSKLNS